MRASFWACRCTHSENILRNLWNYAYILKQTFFYIRISVIYDTMKIGKKKSFGLKMPRTLIFHNNNDGKLKKLMNLFQIKEKSFLIIYWIFAILKFLAKYLPSKIKILNARKLWQKSYKLKKMRKKSWLFIKILFHCRGHKMERKISRNNHKIFVFYLQRIR